jgi:putative zinc finger protein
LDRLSNILKQRLEAAQPAQTEHPSTDMLVAFVERALKTTERERLMGHLSVCPACRQAVSLAAPEGVFENAGAAAASRALPFRLPPAMRWVSLAAALAVAVGVGVISYEHQSAPRQTRMPDMAAARSQVAVQARPASEGEAITKIRKTERKKSAPNNERVDGIPALSPQATNGSFKGEKVERADNSLGARLGKEKKAAIAAEARQSQLTDSFANRRDQGNENAGQAGASAPVMATASAPASVQATKELHVDRSSAQRNAESSSVQGALVGGVVGGRLQSGPAAAKVIRSVAIGGPSTAKASAVDYGEFVRWTISAGGQLQRNSQDGALTVVEPAPGVTIRAVAAEGIEVWAAGVQPDLHADQWQQRPVLFHSSDAGETWTRINGPWQTPISSLNLTSKSSLIVLAQDGAWITSDAGKSWDKK